MTSEHRHGRTRRLGAHQVGSDARGYRARRIWPTAHAAVPTSVSSAVSRRISVTGMRITSLPRGYLADGVNHPLLIGSP